MASTQPLQVPGHPNPPLVEQQQQRPHLMMSASPVRSLAPGDPNSENPRGPPLARPPMGLLRPGPSPLFPPQAVMPCPPQAAGVPLQPFPPPGLPATIPPGGLQMPPRLPPSTPPVPPGGLQMPPHLSPGNSQIPVTTSLAPPTSTHPGDRTVSTSAPLVPPHIPPGGLMMPTTPPTVPYAGPQQISPGNQQIPPGGLQMLPHLPRSAPQIPITAPQVPISAPLAPSTNAGDWNVSTSAPLVPPHIPPGGLMMPTTPPTVSYAGPQQISPGNQQIPPGGLQMLPHLPRSAPQIPITAPQVPISAPLAPSTHAGDWNVSTSAPLVPPHIPPGGLMMPTTPPTIPYAGPQQISPGNQQIPPGGLQMLPHLPRSAPQIPITAPQVPISAPLAPSTHAGDWNVSTSSPLVPPHIPPGGLNIPTTGPAIPTSGIQIPFSSPHRPTSNMPISHTAPPNGLQMSPSGPPMSTSAPTPNVPTSTTQLPPSIQSIPPLLPSVQQGKEEAGKAGPVGGLEEGKGAGGGGGGGGGGEVWYEHKMSDGRVYYSHSQTQKTTWDRPPSVQILPHPAQQSPSPKTAASAPSGPVVPQLTPFPGLPLPGMPSAPQLVPTRVWSEYSTPEGKPYFYNKVTRVSVWEKPKDFDLVMPLPAELGGAPSRTPQSQAQQFPSSNAAGVLSTALPRMSLPHPTQSLASRPPLIGGPPTFNPGRPPFNMGFPPGHPGQHMMNPGLPLPLPQFPPPAVHRLRAPGGMVEARSRDKMAAEQEEVEMDKAEKDGERLSSDVEPESDDPSNPTLATAAAGKGEEDGEGKGEEGKGPKKEEKEEEEAVGSTPSQSVESHSVPEPAPVPVKEELKGPRPTASIPIAGTPWSVVWTSDDRQFFFDVSSRVSLWIMPEELKDNPQLHKILESGPDRSKRVGELKTDEPPAAKRAKLEEDDEGEGNGEEEGMEGMEEGGGVDIPLGVPVQMSTKPPLTTGAMETEKNVALLRSSKTVEERQGEFKEMLLERGVSAFSTWDKELPKFIFDPRYMLLNSKERKSCFEEFIRSRAEEERKEKRSTLKAKRDEFRKLLEESKLHPKSSFSEFAGRYGRDERFKAVEKMREREQLFSDYLQELKRASRHKQKPDSSTHHTTTHHSSSSSSSSRSKSDKIKSEFLEMLSEDISLSESSQWRKVKGNFERDLRYRAVMGGSTQREEWFREHVNSLGSKQVDPGRAREERIQASLKEREREVKMSRSAHEKEWGRERDQLRKTEAVQQFKAILVDVVRNVSLTWHDVRRQLRQDPRWAATELLDIGEKERLFQEHTDGLTERKRLQFRRLLEETSQITLVMPWKKARKLIKEDPRYKNFTESDHRREAEYDKYLRDKMVSAKNEFRSFLRETKVINYKSHKLVKDSERHYKEIIKVLENDQRYLVLECVAEERERILQDFMEELHMRGTPPPPTATNPSERLRKL